MTTTPAATDGRAVRDRLIGGLAHALEERRLVDVTMNDIVRNARTSKRTFYEHFSDKEACFVTLYTQACDGLAAAQEQALDPAMPVDELIAMLTRVYLAYMAAGPAIARAALSDIVAGGDTCLAARRQQHERTATELRALFARARELQPEAGIEPLTQESAAAVVGGINELVLRAFDLGAADRLPELAPTIERLLRSVVLTP